jgi:hypothetical protein
LRLVLAETLFEEVFFHFVDNPIRDFALSASPEAAPHQRPVSGFTCPNHRLFLHADQLKKALTLAYGWTRSSARKSSRRKDGGCHGSERSLWPSPNFVSEKSEWEKLWDNTV